MLVRKDGRVAVIEKSTGKEVWLYPVDAREAVSVGSHAYPKGKELPSSSQGEIESLRKRVAELEASQAAKPEPTAPVEPVKAPAAPPAPKTPPPAPEKPKA